MDPLILKASVMGTYFDIVDGVSDRRSKTAQNPVSTQFRDRVQQITSTSPSLTLAANPSVANLLRSLQRHRLLDDVPKRPKCEQTAIQHRQQGNQLYKARKFDDAVDEYNASIAFAESGSQNLGIAYANRSSVCFEEGEYEMALINIGLAKANNYPAGLLPQLLTREQKCKENLRGDRPKRTTLGGRRMPINVEVNPTIPSVAKGIYMQVDAKTRGYGLWTARDFKTGDVILHERTMLANMDSDTKYSACSYCYAKEGIVSRLLVPCSKCTMVMFCNDECMRNGWHYFHRFECDISEKIVYVSGGSLMFGVRMFFYELAMFGDDLDKMMKHHRNSNRARKDPFSVEYAEDGSLKNATDFYDVIFRKTPPAKPEQKYMANVFAAAASLCFLQYPFVQQLNAQANKQVKKFTLDIVAHYTQICFQHSRRWCHYAISSICKNSCDPNVSYVSRNGHMKFIALRPIRKGEEIFASNCFEWWTPPEMRRLRPSEQVCQCCVCDPTQQKKWRASGKALTDAARGEWKAISRLVVESSFDDAAKFNAMQQFIERYAHVHPNKQFAMALAAFQRLAEYLIIEEFDAHLRSGLLSKIQD